MDIEEYFQRISKNPSVTLAELEAFYSSVVTALESSPDQLNSYIKRLKALCLDRAIDHERFKFREVAIAKKKETVSRQPVKETKLPIPGISTIITRVVKLCREKCPFLSFGIIRSNNETAGTQFRLKILFSDSISEDWVHSTFQPDVAELISDFKSELLNPKSSWVVLFLFHCSDRGVVGLLQQVLQDNPEHLIFNLEDYERGESESQYWNKDSRNIFNGTASEKSSVLIHDTLDSEQEYLIKEFFGSKAGFLVCSNLKGGFSGALVILVELIVGPGDKRKYVVKVCEKQKFGLMSDLKKEHDNFRNFVEPFWVPEQYLSVEFKESPRYEALRYPFASVDTITLSSSFSDVYRENNSGEDFKIIITKIFNHTLCQKWRDRTKKRKQTFSEAFKPVTTRSDSEKYLDKLLSPEFSTESTLDRVSLRKVLNAEIEFLECLNHGDLHSGNIQVQKETKDIFLIDFGWTETYPAGLDYAALEASIRFKLLDHSIDPRVFLSRDENPLQKFDNLITQGETFDSEAEKAEKVSSLIREKFLNDFTGKDKSNVDLQLQYLCCLLAICLRQVKYDDLNRRYILQFMSQIIPPLSDHLT